MADCTEKLPRTVWWQLDSGRGGVWMIDQTKLPVVGETVCCETHARVIDAIKRLVVRGAPAIGVSGALALAVWVVNESSQGDVDGFIAAMEGVASEVAQARPTAVALSWAVNRVMDFARAKAAEGVGLEALKAAIVEFAESFIAEDEAINRAIGEHGAKLLKPGSRIMTHCNAGSLATAFFGTALGIIYTGFNAGLVERVYCCETRPVNQGGRLTAWELSRAGIPTTLICDNMAATVLGKGMVDAVIVGADRIAANGDTANKIGTCGHAIIAKRFGVPFYVAAPMATIDMALASGEEIVIEQRSASEILGNTSSGFFDTIAKSPEFEALDTITQDGPMEFSMVGGGRFAIDRDLDGRTFAYHSWLRNTPDGIDVFNPAFDVTPAELIDGIITENGIYTRGEDGAFHF